MISVTLSKALILGFHFSKFLCYKPTTFPKELHRGSLLSSANFFRIDKKTTLGEQFRKVKQVLQRRGGGTRVVMELQKIPK